MIRSSFLYSLIVLCLSMGVAGGLTGCGIKPGSVDPPPGAENNGFPRTYPDPSTDPRPAL